ncbi:MAG: DUF6438 domain-containing protein [Polyangiaceae bacterium]
MWALCASGAASTVLSLLSGYPERSTTARGETAAPSSSSPIGQVLCVESDSTGSDTRCRQGDGWSCGTTATRPIAVDWEKAVLDGVIIRQIHGPCFGTCPAYSITIWGDGRIEYFGASQVLACGVRHKQIAMEDVRRLIDSARTSGFFWRDVEPDKLCDFWTDLPTVVTRIDMPGYGRAIEHSYGVRCFPEELQAFEDEIPRVAGVQEWTGTGDRLRFCDAVDR